VRAARSAPHDVDAVADVEAAVDRCLVGAGSRQHVGRSRLQLDDVCACQRVRFLNRAAQRADLVADSRFALAVSRRRVRHIGRAVDVERRRLRESSREQASGENCGAFSELRDAPRDCLRSA